eukprot:gnl/TRDRNA2_/TRDRNA2_12136_c0_seq1.p1 gnl/TRDRNA2_/TRDRNA2_12136_c0~~gnl/TRDRNA2_/TRDRNA2_12136_c0_seq1.p1  ORF type:complete len:226 (-),score=8.52 gnl/TRDRNA2_/TRDRNA2_12136_c0_seq1:73-723(-)
MAYVIAAFTFSLGCHIPTPRIFSELGSDARNTWTCVTIVVYTFILGVYIPVGYCGYRKFGSQTASDIITNYSGSSIASKLLRVANGWLAVFGYALNHYMARSAVYSLLVRLRLVRAQADNEEPLFGQPREIPEPWRARITVSIYFVSVTIAIMCKLGQINSFLGASCGSLVIFFFPATFAWKMPSSSPIDIYKVAAMVFGVFGCIALVFGLPKFDI